MNSREMCDRTRMLAVRIVRLVASLPKSREGDVLGRQVLRSGTSIGANYREACRASSRKHFVSTLEISLRECDETDYWLDLLAESGLVRRSRLNNLINENREILAILAASVRTAKRRLHSKTRPAPQSEI